MHMKGAPLILIFFGIKTASSPEGDGEHPLEKTQELLQMRFIKVLPQLSANL